MLATTWEWLRYQHPEVLGALMGMGAMVVLVIVLAIWALGHFGRELYKIDGDRY
jgi:hypothetical protein